MLEVDRSNPDTPKPEKIKKSFGHLLNLLKKRRVLDHIIQRKRNS